jgi:hypothetical protein
MLEAKVIRSRITQVGTLAASVQQEIHVLACSIVGHALQHGDVTLADALLQGVGKGVRHQALVAWFETFGPFRFNTKDGVFGLNKKSREEINSQHAPNAYVEQLETGTTWFDYTRETVKSTYDVEKMVQGILNTANAKTKKGETVLGMNLMADLHEVLLRHKLRELEARKVVTGGFGEVPQLKIA